MYSLCPILSCTAENSLMSSSEKIFEDLLKAAKLNSIKLHKMALQLEKLPARIRDILVRAGLLTSKMVLETPDCVLRNLGCLTTSDINQIYCLAAEQVKLPELIKGDQLLANGGQLTTGCAALDGLLLGGLVTRGITEISGHSGCGKTQLCLQLSITVQLPLSVGGLSGGAAFICTEDRFPSVRLHQLLTECPAAKEFPDLQFGNNIFVEHVADAADLRKCVDERVPHLIQKHRIKLIVVDSVAAVFRADYTAAESLQRARDLRAFALQLHSLANTHNITVVCVNQVSDVRRGEGTETVPALGLAWANLVTCRLLMFCRHSSRWLKVGFAPDLPQASCPYKITAAGVVGIT